MQDTAGCRLTVADLVSQDDVVAKLTGAFDKTTVVDRRQSPSHGYRAVHVIVTIDEKPIEVQVRTSLQHLWAELSEKLSDVKDPSIKYGGGDEETRSLLLTASDVIAGAERNEVELRRLAGGTGGGALPRDVRQLQNGLDETKRELSNSLQEFIAAMNRANNRQ